MNVRGNPKLLGPKYWDRVASDCEAQCADMDEVALIQRAAATGCLKVCAEGYEQLLPGEFYPTESGTLQRCR